MLLLNIHTLLKEENQHKTSMAIDFSSRYRRQNPVKLSAAVWNIIFLKGKDA